MEEHLSSPGLWLTQVRQEIGVEVSSARQQRAGPEAEISVTRELLLQKHVCQVNFGSYRLGGSRMEIAIMPRKGT